MRFNLLTIVLLATVLVEASCTVGLLKDWLRNVVHEVRTAVDAVLGEKPGRCIMRETPPGASFVEISCVGRCKIEPGYVVPVGTRITYSCNEGYVLSGSDVSTCNNGVWDTTVSCIKTCQALQSNTVEIFCRRHGEPVSCQSDILPGTIAILACKHSYGLPITEDPGYREITCLDGGIWDHLLFHCQHVYRNPMTFGSQNMLDVRSNFPN